MVPETCEPTRTVTMGLMVPVASTTSSICPRSTWAVKCCAWALRLRPKITKRTTDTVAAAKMNHFALILMYASQEVRLSISSFVAQRLNRVQQGCLSRGVVSKEDAHRDGEHGRHYNRFNRHLNRPMQRLSDHIRTENAAENTHRAANQAEHDGLPKEL